MRLPPLGAVSLLAFEKAPLPELGQVPGSPGRWGGVFAPHRPPTGETSPGTAMSGASKTHVMRIFWPDFLA